MIVPQPLADVARSLLPPDTKPPALNKRRLRIKDGCPCCAAGFSVQPGDLDDDAPWPSGNLILEAVTGGTRIKCSRCDLHGFETVTKGAFPDILAAAHVGAPGELLPTLAGVPFLPSGVDVLASGQGTFALARAITEHVSAAGHAVLYIGHPDAWPEGASCVDPDELLPQVLADPVGWWRASRGFELIVVDLTASKDRRLPRALTRPCRGHATVLLLDSDGASSRRIDAAVKLSTRVRRFGESLSLLVACEHARPARAPFGVGERWIGRDAGEGLIFELAPQGDDRLAAVVLALLDAAQSVRAIAQAAGVPATTTWRRLQELEERGEAERTPDGWVFHPEHASSDGTVEQQPANDGAEPETGVPRGVPQVFHLERLSVSPVPRGTEMEHPVEHPQSTVQSQNSEGVPGVPPETQDEGAFDQGDGVVVPLERKPWVCAADLAERLLNRNEGKGSA